MHQLEVIVNLWLQSLGEWLRTPMLFFSFLGTQNAYMILMSVMYWTIDNRLGIRLGISLLISNVFNTGLKWLLRFPRPYWVDARVKVFSTESSFGLPSGHAMISTTVWGWVILWFKQRWITLLLIIMLFFIGISRLFLGVHFLSDVLVGWLFGFILLITLEKFEKPVLRWLDKFKFHEKLFFFFTSSLLVIAFFLTFFLSLSNWAIPEKWILISQAIAPESNINPFKIKDIFMVSGSWFGMLSGVYLIKELGGFNIEKSISNKFFRLIVGIIGLFFFAFGLTKFVPESNDWIAYSLIYLQYALIGFWATGLAPYIFIKFHLASKNE